MEHADRWRCGDRSQIIDVHDRHLEQRLAAHIGPRPVRHPGVHLRRDHAAAQTVRMSGYFSELRRWRCVTQGLWFRRHHHGCPDPGQRPPVGRQRRPDRDLGPDDRDRVLVLAVRPAGRRAPIPPPTATATTPPRATTAASPTVWPAAVPARPTSPGSSASGRSTKRAGSTTPWPSPTIRRRPSSATRPRSPTAATSAG